ncbi:hypothetical protein Ddc_15797 [Ditylenchus destructor]|nr:hypothetical protein Ddc_15797 [Ditylenchus destructor]
MAPSPETPTTDKSRKSKSARRKSHFPPIGATILSALFIILFILTIVSEIFSPGANQPTRLVALPQFHLVVSIVFFALSSGICTFYGYKSQFCKLAYVVSLQLLWIAGYFVTYVYWVAASVCLAMVLFVVGAVLWSRRKKRLDAMRQQSSPVNPEANL